MIRQIVRPAFVAACFVWLLSSDFIAAPFVGDSLIVDGQAVEIEIDLSLVAAALERPETSRSSGRSRAYVALDLGAGVHSSSSSSVAARALRRGRPFFEMNAVWMPALRIERDPKAFRPELRFGCSFISILGFDTGQLHDSAVAYLTSTPGRLDQLLELHYDLGVEIDTLPLSLSAEMVRVYRLELGAAKTFQQGNSRPFHVHTGLWLSYENAGRAERAVSLGEGLAWYADDGGLDWGVWVSVERGLGARHRLGEQQGVYAAIRARGGARWSAGLGLGYAW